MDYLIHRAGDRFLKGHDGTCYEWTGDPRVAWAFDRDEAHRRLERVQRSFPEAEVVSRAKALRMARKSGG